MGFLRQPIYKTGGGTSLPDVPGWFPNHDFWIPEGTEYSDELVISKEAKEKSSPFNPNLKGFHYQIECKAVVRQCELAKSNLK